MDAFGVLPMLAYLLDALLHEQAPTTLLFLDILELPLHRLALCMRRGRVTTMARACAAGVVLGEEVVFRCDAAVVDRGLLHDTLAFFFQRKLGQWEL